MTRCSYAACNEFHAPENVGVACETTFYDRIEGFLNPQLNQTSINARKLINFMEFVRKIHHFNRLLFNLFTHRCLFRVNIDDKCNSTFRWHYVISLTAVEFDSILWKFVILSVVT